MATAAPARCNGPHHTLAPHASGASRQRGARGSRPPQNEQWGRERGKGGAGASTPEGARCRRRESALPHERKEAQCQRGCPRGRSPFDAMQLSLGPCDPSGGERGERPEFWRARRGPKLPAARRATSPRLVVPRRARALVSGQAQQIFFFFGAPSAGGGGESGVGAASGAEEVAPMRRGAQSPSRRRGDVDRHFVARSPPPPGPPALAASRRLSRSRGREGRARTTRRARARGERGSDAHACTHMRGARHAATRGRSAYA